MKRKRILASFLAAVLLESLLPAAFATEADDSGTTPTTYTLTINNTESGYSYEAYQIFTGTLSGNTPETYVLSDVEWGTGVSEAGKTALAGVAGVTADATYTAAQVAEGLAGKSAVEVAKKMKDSSNVTNVNFTATKSDGGKYTFQLPAGYYFVKNTVVPTGDGAYNKAFSDCIIRVVGTVEVETKTVLPTVGKQVQDEAGDADPTTDNEWGEAADHEINESFQFRLFANIPDDKDLDNYEKYKLVFHDTMDTGITFEEIVSVKIGDTLVNPKGTNSAENDALYECTASAGTTGDWTLTIPDAIKVVGTAAALRGKQVEAVYKAHLNEKAKIVTTPGANSNPNQNAVYLEYSNYPHVDASGNQSTGKTETDIVHVFTYGVSGYKFTEGSDGTKKPLNGVKFKLLDSSGKEIKLSYKEDSSTSGNSFYYPDSNGTAELQSDSNGYFRIYGLDVGTYTLKETAPLEGYNACADMTLKVGYAENYNHKETADKVSASVTYTLSVNDVPNSSGTVEIENRSGATLPTTGSIGTTIFYVLGSILVIGAVVLLVSKKRMNDAE